MNRMRSYCGPPGITAGDLLGKPGSAWEYPQNDSRHVYYMHRGRCGLGALCDYWNLGPGDEILVPAYNCGSEIDPFLRYNLKVIFYRVDRNANIDIEDIRRRVTNRTKVIYVTHYFGWPHKIEELSDYCRKNKINLIEDCALSLFSNPVDFPIGVLGDAAIYSFPKTLPVPDGGALVVGNDIQLSEISKQTPGFSVILNNMFPLIKRTALRLSEKMGLYCFLPHCLIRSRNHGSNTVSVTPAGLPEMPQSYYYDKAIEKLAASKITHRILYHSSIETVVRCRRDNYSALFEMIKKVKKICPLYKELPDGVCPLYLPVLVENREAVSIRLNEMGIMVVQWWAGFHGGFDWAEFPEAQYLKEHLLAIPIHQQLTQQNIDYIISSLQS